jgi:hypothetical protein
VATKQNDSNLLRCVISGIENSDVLYSWAAKLTEINKNVLKFKNQFDKPEWYKNSIEVIPNFMIAPNGKRAAEKIIGTGTKKGYISQNFSRKTGTFKFSIWLKGFGSIRLVLQENGGDYTKYGTYEIKLTPNWSQYSIETIKEDDSNPLRCVIDGIEESDVLYSWGAKLTGVEISKIIDDVIIPKNVNNVKIIGWMNLKNSSIKDKYIALKKDNVFSYISLKKQMKDIKNKSLTKESEENSNKDAYIFETTKNILEKGRYEIFQVAMSDENIFYIKKLSNRIIIK